MRSDFFFTDHVFFFTATKTVFFFLSPYSREQACLSLSLSRCHFLIVGARDSRSLSHCDASALLKTRKKRLLLCPEEEIQLTSSTSKHPSRYSRFLLDTPTCPLNGRRSSARLRPAGARVAWRAAEQGEEKDDKKGERESFFNSSCFFLFLLPSPPLSHPPHLLKKKKKKKGPNGQTHHHLPPQRQP